MYFYLRSRWVLILNFYLMWFIVLLKNTSGHGHSHNAAPLVGPHGHSLTVAQGPTVVQGPVHPPTSITSAQGQQFQRLKVHIHLQIPDEDTLHMRKIWVKFENEIGSEMTFISIYRLKMPCPIWIKWSFNLEISHKCIMIFLILWKSLSPRGEFYEHLYHAVVHLWYILNAKTLSFFVTTV